MKKVENHPNLYRDDNTGAIINKDKNGYKARTKILKKLEKQNKRIEELEEKIKKLEKLEEKIAKLNI